MWLPLLRFNKTVCKSMVPLLRFNKSACKSWRALIQASFFVDRQITTTTSSSSKFGSFILQTYKTSFDSYKNSDIKVFKLSFGSHDHDDQKKMVFKLDEDFGFSAFYKNYLLRDSLIIVGSCNGIICLHDPNVAVYERGFTKHHYSHIRDVSLWNPATRQFRILPKSIPIQENKYRGLQGGHDDVSFGFDVKTKDYKVLRITPLWEEEGGCMSKVQVYSLSTDSWRLLEDIVLPNDSYGPDGSHFFVERKPYSNDGMMLLSFDFTNEIFITMQLPEWAAAFTTPRIDSDVGYWYFDIWVLNKQHGSSVAVYKESWTKLHSFQIKMKSNQLYSEPRCISNNGEFALISTGWNRFQLFNLVTKESIKDFAIGGCGSSAAAFAYEESLVSIMGGNDLLRWQLPTHGTTYKLNLDAPFIDRCVVFGIGLCLTSDTGGCIGVRSLRRHVRDATEGEARAMLEAIKWVKKLELSPIIIESDSKNVVSFFMEDDDDNNSTCWSSEALSLLSEAKLLLNSFELDISFQYCSKSCNYVADIAAKLGREGLTWTCKDWTANFPGEIVMSLSKNLGLETRERS